MCSSDEFSNVLYFGMLCRMYIENEFPSTRFWQRAPALDLVANDPIRLIGLDSWQRAPALSALVHDTSVRVILM